MSSTTTQRRRLAVLGGSAGIGLAVARRMAAAGAEVTLGGRDRQRLDDACGLLDAAAGIVVDAEDPSSLGAFFADAGPIDDLVITVTRRGGAGPVGALAETDLVGAFAGKPVAHLRAIALALPTLSEHGSITLVTAGSAQSAFPGTVGLAAVNGALEAAIGPLAVELAPRRVNAVSPGVIETDWWSAMPDDDRAATLATFAARAPVGRNGAADDVAGAIAALIDNTFITGVVLPCDGGLRLT